MTVADTSGRISPIGFISTIVMGALVTVLPILVWTSLVTVLTARTVPPPLAAAAVAGAIMGIVYAVVRDRIPHPAAAPATGAAIGGLWLLLSGARSLGFETSGLPAAVGTVAVFAAAGFLLRPALDRVGLSSSRKDVAEVVFIRILLGLGYLFFILIVLFPFYFMLASSLKPRAEYLQDPTNLGIDFSGGIASLLVGFDQVLTRFRFARYIMNSAIVSVATVILTLIPAILGAYAVTRLEFPGRKLLSRSILLIYMFPAIVLVIPLYSIFTRLGLRNSLPGLLVVYPAMTIPVALYMLRSYFLTLPKDLEEAALIDGLTRFRVILLITLPLSVPALASVALYVFMIAWNEFLFAFMFLDTPAIFTLSRGMVGLDSQEVPRQYLMAGAVIITVPIMVLFFWFEKYLVGGLTTGGVKG